MNVDPELDPIGALDDDSFGGRLRDWGVRHAYLTATLRDGSDDPALPAKFGASVLQGATLLREAEEALLEFAIGSMDCWYDNAEHFNCGEAEMMAGLIRLVHGEHHAKQFLMAHAEDDDEGDLHWALRSEDAEEGDDD